MEIGSLEAKSFLVGAEGSKILGSFWCDIIKEFEDNSAVLLAVVDVEENFCLGHNYNINITSRLKI